MDIIQFFANENLKIYQIDCEEKRECFRKCDYSASVFSPNSSYDMFRKSSREYCTQECANYVCQLNEKQKSLKPKG